MQTHFLGFAHSSVFLAYIDPNTGGLLMQYLVPVFVAIGAAWVFLKDKVSEAVARIFRRSRQA
jgi:hypothetical protein